MKAPSWASALALEVLRQVNPKDEHKQAIYDILSEGIEGMVEKLRALPGSEAAP